MLRVNISFLKMNHSSLFSFEESSVWDPKVIMKHLIVPQDQLTKLNSIPGWTKVQNNQNTLRLDKDYSIENSQIECSVNVTHIQRIEKNTELFDEQTANRKSILETYKLYDKKLTRSLSFFTINKYCENLFNNETLKRTLSLQSICQLSDVSDIDEHFENFKNSVERHPPSDHSEPFKSEEAFLSKKINSKAMETIPQLPIVDITPLVENATLEKENNGILLSENAVTGIKQLICTTDKPIRKHESVNVLIHSETTKENNSVLHVDNTDLLSGTRMENNSVLHANNADSHSETTKENDVLHADDADLHFVATKEKNSVLCANKNAALDPNMSVQFIKHNTELTNSNIAYLHSEATKESNVLSTESADSCLNNVSDEPEKTLASVITDLCTSIISSMDKVFESPVSCESLKLDKNDAKEVATNEISITSENESLVLKERSSFTMEETISPFIAKADVAHVYIEPSVSVECLAPDLNPDEKIIPKNIVTTSVEKNNDMSSPEPCSSKCTVIDISTKKLPLPKKEAETSLSVKNSDVDMTVIDMENNKKECNDKTCDLSKSSDIDETSVSKKRKLESRNKRSKKLKSEEKHGNLKIRSIKKVGEIYYSTEEVKTMLDIMKQLL